MPRVDVIVLNYNGKQFLHECLVSLEKQTYQDFEILVVDNASTDDSLEYLRLNFPAVKLLLLAENYGFCGGNNRGILSLSSEYVALLNTDTQVEPGWLESLVSVLEHEATVGFCASKMIQIQDKTTIDTAGDVFYTHGVGGKRGSGLSAGDHYDNPDYVFGACAGAVIYRRSMLDKVGLFDEDFFAYGEDVDLSFRCQLQGYRCKYVPDAIVYHHVGGSFGRLSSENIACKRRNMLEVLIKNMPVKALLRYLPLVIAYYLMGDLRYILQGYGKAVLKARYDNLRRLPVILNKRQTIQSERTLEDHELLSLFSHHPISHWIDFAKSALGLKSK